jgi:ATP-dependent DNA helicase DinG
MDPLLPPPVEFGLPERYVAWRKGQPEAILRALDTDRRISALVLPTGAGKSLVYMALTRLSGAHRTVVLTRTRALQAQLEADYSSLPGVSLVQGQHGYICVALEPYGHLFSQYGEGRAYQGATSVANGPCHTGVDCHLKRGGCPYYDALRRANQAEVIITNYAWWFTLMARGDIALNPDLLICDEAHEAPSALADAIGATIQAGDVAEVLQVRMPRLEALDAAGWVRWAADTSDTVRELLEGTRANTRDAMRKLRRAQWLQFSLDRIRAIDPALLLLSPADGGVRFDVAWAAPYAERWLFRSVKKIVMTSAFLGQHTADLLGVPPNALDLYESGDGFPLARRPVYICTSPLIQRVDHRMTPDQEKRWVAEIDRILEARPDRKGIIHTVSYKRRDHLLLNSACRDRMMTHGRHDTIERIEAFRAAKPGAVLVSPAVTTGYDFPYEDCEFQILAKVPFPDARDPVVKVRSQIDPLYPAYSAMQEVVQAVGRGMRAPDDRCETFLVDRHFRWFLAKHQNLAPLWFRRALKRVDAVPGAPEKLPAVHSA